MMLTKRALFCLFLASSTFFDHPSFAIQCFSCKGSESYCRESFPKPTICPPEAAFCKLVWSHVTNSTFQSCVANFSDDCSYRSEEENSFDISSCCNFDGCNCIGSQCDLLEDVTDVEEKFSPPDNNNDDASATSMTCYSCMGQSADCERSSPMVCPHGTEYCKLEWLAATEYTVQMCATSSDCDKSLVAKIKDVDIYRCFNYDKGNCIGNQCSDDDDGSSSSSSSQKYVTTEETNYKELLSSSSSEFRPRFSMRLSNSKDDKVPRPLFV